MSAKPIELGTFRLVSLIGRGGSAEVWRAEHVQSRAPVAVKVVTASHAREPRYRAAFRNEVQAVVRLFHPGIVLVLDHGEVGEEAEARSEGNIAAGCPYFVMELASWGSLDRVRTPLPFSDVLRILSALLEALAHAHARGVIHRDLKPANVLLAAPTDARPGLKLTDFGIAHALEADQVGADCAGSGTPHFMAPEQFMGEWRDYGPWTDLYAVGCLAHVLATGKLPFVGDSAIQLAYAHLHLIPPSLAIDPAVPAEFEGWVQRLMQKSPGDRFQRAADAGWALMQLARGTPGVPESQIVRPPRKTPTNRTDPGDLATLVHATRIGATLPWFSDTPLRPSIRTPPRSSGKLAARPLPPLPSTWRRSDERAPNERATAPPLVGAGLGLYGLRTIPMVARDEARDAIWRALLDVRETRSPRAVVISGTAGVGKSRLVEWMTERADEVGSAIVLKAIHSPTQGPSDGLGRMLGRHLRTVELTRRQTLARIESQLRAQGVTDAHEWQALTELVQPASRRRAASEASEDGRAGSAGPGPVAASRRRAASEASEDGRATERAIQFGSATERHVLALRLLERIARERPVILWLDDVQWGGDSIAFARRLLRTACAPILCLLTVREETLEERPLERAALEDLLSEVGARSLLLHPLGRDDQRKLVNELLVLDDDLSSAVADRTDGNPLFAVQLVGDWVQRGVLEVAESGFVLKRSERAEIPDDIHQVWRRRIGRLLAARGTESEAALELAAVLGVNVDQAEWSFACEEADVFDAGLIEDLIESRLAVPTEAGWTFAHGMLRESLIRSARENDRYAEHHRTCARMLQRRYGLDLLGIPERLADLLVEAGDLDDALEPLLLGALERLETSQWEEARAAITRREELLQALGATEEDERWGEDWVLLARVATMQGGYEDALRWASQAERSARRWGWRSVLPEALEIEGTVLHECGDPNAAMTAFIRAREIYEWNEDSRGISDVLFGLGEALFKLGDHEASEERYLEGLRLAEAHENVRGMAKHLLGIGFVQLRRSDLDAALTSFHRQLELVEQIGDRFRIAQCLSALGEVARRSGDLEQAEQSYRRALSIDEAIGSTRAALDRLNVALVLLAQEEYSAARELIEEAHRAIGTSAEPSQRVLLHTALLACFADGDTSPASQDWKAWDQHFQTATRLLRRTRMQDEDLAWLLVAAGRRAADANDPVRARHCFELAIQQWQALGRPDQAEDVERAIALLRRATDIDRRSAVRDPALARGRLLNHPRSPRR